MLVDPSELSNVYGKEVIVADRDFVEGYTADECLVEGARNDDVAFLVVGDAFGATTHMDLVLRAREAGVRVEVVHNAGIMNAPSGPL